MRAITVIEVPGVGCEDVVVDAAGDVWTGTEDGSVFRIRPDGARVERVANTGGRPLGIELYGDRLLIVDAHRGLLVLDPRSGSVECLADRDSGTPMMFCNNAAVARGGDIWFSDSSTRYPIERWKADFAENTRTGRLLRYRPGRAGGPGGEVEVCLDGLAFANGVALAADESWVAVAETGARSVARLWLTGPRAGRRDDLVEDLPGYPDNIARGSDGLIWVTIASPRDPLIEFVQHRAPVPVRRAVTRLPDALQPKPKRTARVQAYDEDGRLVHDLSADGAEYHMVTGVREHEGRVWLGSLEESAVAVMTL